MVRTIDCGVRIAVDVAALLPERWRRHVETFGRRAAPSLTAVAAPAQPSIDWLAVEMAVLLPTTDAADQQNLELAAAMARAANDLQATEWLAGDARLRGSIVVAHEDADLAVEEI